MLDVVVNSFNPCYNGSGVRSRECKNKKDNYKSVSILVIMEVG